MFLQGKQFIVCIVKLSDLYDFYKFSILRTSTTHYFYPIMECYIKDEIINNANVYDIDFRNPDSFFKH
jgi:hypothetical protein